MDDAKTERAVGYLSQEPLLHTDMLESIRCGAARLLSVTDRGVLILHKGCGAVMMSAADKAEAEGMLAHLDSAPMFVAHQRFYVDAVQKRFSFTECMSCVQAVYRGKISLPEPACEAVIRPLDERSLPFLMEHYSHASDKTYLLDRLRAGVMFGAFLHGELAGFIGMHTEGSMGILEVLPKFRRKGIALALETFLTNRLLAEGKVPFAQIIEGNEASLLLHRKLRFSLSEGTVCWLT